MTSILNSSWEMLSANCRKVSAVDDETTHTVSVISSKKFLQYLCFRVSDGHI